MLIKLQIVLPSSSFRLSKGSRLPEMMLHKRNVERKMLGGATDIDNFFSLFFRPRYTKSDFTELFSSV